jgi:hypothetical protein
MVLITIVAGAYKPTYNWGASHCRSGWGYEATYNWRAPSCETSRAILGGMIPGLGRRVMSSVEIYRLTSHEIPLKFH